MSQSYHFLIKYLKIASQSPELKKNIEKAIKLAIATKSILRFSDLLRLDGIESLGSSPILELLKVFNSGTIVEYKALIKKHPKLLAEMKVPAEDAITKIRILTLASLACNHVGESISYQTVASALDVTLDTVEFWTISGILDRLPLRYQSMCIRR